MHKKLVSMVKYNKFFLRLYRLGGNTLISCVKLFSKPKKKKILFMSFGGQKYDDSPKALYEQMKKDPYFDGYRLIWGFTEPQKYSYVDCDKVKVDTVEFYKTALTSSVWIHNSSMTRGLNLKQKGIFEINTWHGTPLKKMGEDISNNQSYSHKQKNYDVIYCAQSEYDREIFTRLFNTDKENIMISDLPRNDSLLTYSEEEKNKIKNELGIPADKKVILYAPTFREYDRNSTNACYINPPIDIEKWKEKLSDEYVLLFRAHYEIINVLGIVDSDFVKNVSSYHCLNDLMVVSDMLISDYSSIYFDYSILERPMFNFSYDYELYCEKRGLYLDLREVLPCCINENEDELIDEIIHCDKKAYAYGTSGFRKRFCPNSGKASDMVIEFLKKRLDGR